MTGTWNNGDGIVPTPDPAPDGDDIFDPDSHVVTGIRRLAALIAGTAWFTRLGEPIGDDVHRLARSYLEALGCSDAAVALIEDWETAELAATNPEIDNVWWEAEEQLHLAVTAEALELLDEEQLMAALAIISEGAAAVVLEAAEQAAAMADVDDESLIRAAAGAASKTCHQAATVMLAGGADDHPFVYKFRLFEAGRWPISVTGATFNLF